MAMSNTHYNTAPPSIRLYGAAERLSRLQIDFVSEAVKRAVDDAGAAIGHQLSEPLTALLLYLHEIKRSGEHFEGAAVVPPVVGRMVDSALREAQRVCDILERIGKIAEAPIDTDTAVARGHAAINAWTPKNQAEDDSDIAPIQPYTNHHLLTPREHEVLALITGGASNKEGGHQLGISTRTFEVHRAHVMGKLGARNAADLVRIALGSGQ
jgi:DNA-binding CsgD family transcriptional regulator